MEAVERAGNAAGDRIDRLLLAAKALGRAGVEHHRPAEAPAQLGDLDAADERRPVGVGRSVRARAPPARSRARRRPRPRPCSRRRAPRPRHGRASAASTRGARRTCRRCGRAPPPGSPGVTPSAPAVRAKAARVGQRMAAVAAGLLGAQVAVEVDVARARHVAGGVGRFAGGDVAELEAGVEDERRVRAGLQGAQRVDADQGGEGGGRVHTVFGESPISAMRGLRLRSSVADRPAPAIRSMPAIAIAVTLSSNRSTP